MLAADGTVVASVLVVDDQPVFREVARELVAATCGCALVGEADSGEHALELVEQLQPEVVLMDVRMPGIGGIAAARSIKDAHPATAVVLVSTTPPGELPAEAATAHADAAVWKSELTPHVLAQICERVHHTPAAAAS